MVTTIAGNANVPPGEADGTGTNALFYNPTGIAVDPNTNVYVTDSSGQTIRKISPTGTNWTVTTIAGFALTGGNTDGVGTNALFLYPHGITVDSGTNVYVADTVNDTIRKLSPIGTNWVVTTIAGQAGVSGSSEGFGTNVLFYFPEGIALDNRGNLYVADTFNDTLRRLMPAGTNWISTTLGGQVQISGSADGTDTNALFYLPEGIALDDSGDLYVADTYNNSVRFGRIVSGPAMQITMVGGQVVLSWPNTGSYTLQTNGDLSTPSWADYGGTVTTTNGTNSVTVTSPTGNMYFRLSDP